MKSMRHLAVAATALAISLFAAEAVWIGPASAAGNKHPPFLPDIIISSTVPLNGDLNPYGVAIVPRGFPSGGKIMPATFWFPTLTTTPMPRAPARRSSS